MKLIRDLGELDASCRGGAVTIGNFDGVHRGHARIIERILYHAKQLPGPSIVFTFDPHPARLLRPKDEPPPLTWLDRKADLLNELGVDVMVAYPTDQDLLNLDPTEFFQRIVQQALGARAIVEGPNFFFGKSRAGDVAQLKRLCEEYEVNLEIVQPLEFAGQIISSSRVRRYLAQGAVSEVRSMLTQAYRVRGLVTHGAARGRQIGFPTANLEAIDTLVPAPGVYAGWCYTDGERFPAAINIGPNPTFSEHRSKVEVHLLGYAGSLYGRPLEVDFLARLRDIQTFSNVESLLQQLHADIALTAATCEAAA